MNSDDGKENISFASQLQKKQIKFAIICIIISGLVGVFYREFGRVFTEGLTNFEASHALYHLGQTHGHLFNIGFVIPLGLALMTYILRDKLDEKTMKKMNLWFTIYMIAGIGVFLLLLYKGIHYAVYSSVQYTYSLSEIYDLLYGGSVMLKAMLHATIHLTYGGSVILYCIPLLKSLKKLK